MGLELVLEPIVRDAIIFASLLSLLSIGMTTTYMTTKVPNFSHGSIATVGIYVTLTTSELWKSNPYFFLPLAFLLGGASALLLYGLALRPMIDREAPRLVLMVATIAYELILIAVLNIYADYLSRAFKITTRDFFIRRHDVVLFGQPGVFVISPLSVLILVAVLYILLTKTKFGVGMRAAIENAPLAGVVGINVKRIYAFSWFLSGGLAGVAGAMTALWFIADPGYGSRMLVSIFASSIVGGLYNIYGAVLGGFLVGLAEILGTSFLASGLGPWILSYRTLIPLTAMAVTLVLAPRGLTGIDWGQLRGVVKLKLGI